VSGARVNVRESMRPLPRMTQPFLTWVTGVPPADAAPRVLWHPHLAAVTGVAQTAAGIALGAVALHLPWYALVPLLLVAWPTIGGGLRRLDVVVVHQTLHRMFARSDRANRVVSEIVTTLLWRPPYDGNRKEHLVHHAHPCSFRDGDTQYLLSTGAAPGMTEQQFRRYLWRAVFSPRHHWSFTAGRVRANVTGEQPVHRRVMSLAYLTLTVAGLALTGWWLYWLLLWLLPATFFFQAQTFLYTLSEHRWWLFDNAERLTKSQRDQLTFGRFCGEPAPAVAGRPWAVRQLAWARWWLRMVLVYAPYRMWVLVGDTVQHDLHHVRPKCDWANSSWVRNADLRSSEAGRYYEVWGGLLSHVYAGNSVRGWQARPSVDLTGTAAR
jgi:Fatty acid desaturase